jgi:hypothetical protein
LRASIQWPNRFPNLIIVSIGGFVESHISITFIGTWPLSNPSDIECVSICSQFADPLLKNRLISLFNFSESDTHSVCASEDYTAGGHDFRAGIDDSDLDLQPEIQGSRGRYKAAMHAEIAGVS